MEWFLSYENDVEGLKLLKIYLFYLLSELDPASIKPNTFSTLEYPL